MEEEYYKDIAEKFFSNVPKEELPRVDHMLKALEIAKGAKFRLSPNVLEKMQRAEEDPQVREAHCTVPNDICILCDNEIDDICNLCDVFDCGVGPDPGPAHQ
jgi:hypothetical protein